MEPPREYKQLGNPRGQESGGNMKANDVYSCNVQRPTSLDPYETQSGKGIQNL